MIPHLLPWIACVVLAWCNQWCNLMCNCPRSAMGWWVLPTDPDSSNRLRRSHMTQYCRGYCKLEYRCGYLEVTCSYCDRSTVHAVAAAYQQYCVIWDVHSSVRRNLDVYMNNSQNTLIFVHCSERKCKSLNIFDSIYVLFLFVCYCFVLFRIWTIRWIENASNRIHIMQVNCICFLEND